jgi:IS30 family transposase
MVSKAIKNLLKPFKHVCHSIPFDNGGEFAGHQSIAKALKCRPISLSPITHGSAVSMKIQMVC